MKAYLISCDYEYYCQGYEWTNGIVLVHADSFEQACQKIIDNKDYYHAENFKNLTIGLED